MAKFEVEMEITGFKLKIKGERETAAELGAVLQSQVANLLPTGLIEAKTSGSSLEASSPRIVEAKIPARKPARKRVAEKPDSEIASIDLQHDPNRYGNPVQTWKHADKLMWLIYVITKQTAITHLTPTQISETFNSNFGRAGTLRPSNVSRDLKSQKAANPPLVSQETKSGKYGLFDSGEKHVESLIKTALTQP